MTRQYRLGTCQSHKNSEMSGIPRYHLFDQLRATMRNRRIFQVNMSASTYLHLRLLFRSLPLVTLYHLTSNLHLPYPRSRLQH